MPTLRSTLDLVVLTLAFTILSLIGVVALAASVYSLLP